MHLLDQLVRDRNGVCPKRDVMVLLKPFTSKRQGFSATSIDLAVDLLGIW